MLKNKVARIETGDSNRDVIVSFLESDGEGIDLTDKQKELLERWSTADDLIRGNVGRKNREAIAMMLVSKYSIARCTAYNDIVNAEFVFSSSKPINKKYLIGLRIEFIISQIHAAQSVSDFSAVASLEKILQGYIELYPETKVNQSPRTLIFNVDARSISDQILDAEDAEAIIDAAIKQLPDGAE
jgi:hypothetical protein